MIVTVASWRRARAGVKVKTYVTSRLCPLPAKETQSCCLAAYLLASVLLLFEGSHGNKHFKLRLTFFPSDVKLEHIVLYYLK